MDPREVERFEEGIEPEFQDVEQEISKDTTDNADQGTHGPGASHGGFGSSSLQECLDMDRLNLTRVDAPAPCHSGVKIEDSSNPPQVMSPNVGEEQVHDTMSASRLFPEDESQSRMKEERKEEDVTPKPEAATVGTKEEPAEHDSEDSFRPEHVAEELQRLIAEFPPAVDPASQQPIHEQREGATAPEVFREIDGPYAPRRSTRYRGRPVVPRSTHVSHHYISGWNMIKKLAPLKTRSCRFEIKCPLCRPTWRR